MKRILFVFLLFLFCQSAFADRKENLPNVHIVATGGTIAGKSAGSSYGYNAGQVAVQEILDAVPGLDEIANITYQQFCNIGSQDMNQNLWLSLARLVNTLLSQENVDAVVITHGTDTMEETAFFLNLTTGTDKPVVLVGAMRPSDSPEADGPDNILLAVRTAVDPESKGKEVMCSVGGRIFGASSIYKEDTHSIDAFSSIEPVLHTRPFKPEFDVDSISSLPQVGIVYCYAGDCKLPLKAYMKHHFNGVVLAGVGMGNLNEEMERLAKQAVDKGMIVVRSTRVPRGGVYTEFGEIDDLQRGFVAACSFNPQKARVLLMLALAKTSSPEAVRLYFKQTR